MIQPARAQPPLVIYGAGGHGRVVAEAAVAAGFDLLGFRDDARHHPDHLTAGPWRILEADDPRLPAAMYIVGIGDNAARQTVLQRLQTQGHTLATVVHPTACVSSSATLGQGVYVGPLAAINAGAQVGVGGIVNTHAVVEHDCLLDDFSHVAPGAVLGGGVQVGVGTLVGLGARILPHLRLGSHGILGGGSVLLQSMPADEVWVGHPARPR